MLCNVYLDVLDTCVCNSLLSCVMISFLLCSGVHTAVNIDNNTQCSYMWCLLGACLPLPILVFSSKLDTFLTYSCLASVAVAHAYGIQSRQKSKDSTGSTHSMLKNDTCHAWLCLSAANLLMAAMLVSALYHNCYVTTRDGVHIPLKDAFRNMLESPAWAEFRRTVQHLFHCLINEGLHKFVYEFRIVLDPEGENSAYKVSHSLHYVAIYTLKFFSFYICFSKIQIDFTFLVPVHLGSVLFFSRP